MANLTRLGVAAQRSAEAILRGAGGRAVMLLMPEPGVQGDVTEQLGLATPTFAEVELAPVFLRVLSGTTAGEGQRWEMVVAAAPVAEAAGGPELETVLALFGAAAGVVVDGVLLQIKGVSFRDVAGVPYLYQIELLGVTGAGT